MKGNSKQSGYNKQRLLLILKGLIPSFLTLFTKRDKKHIVFCSSYTTKFQFNSRYLFLYFLKHYPDWKVEFVINDEEQRQKLISEIGPHFIETNTVKGKMHALKAAVWVPATLETPVSGLFLSFRRLVYHVGHGVPFKCFGGNEKELSLVKRVYINLIRTNFSKMVANNKDYVPVMAGYINSSQSKIVINGLPRNDMMYVKQDISVLREVLPEMPTCKKAILYAPTWRPYAELELFPFPDLDIDELDRFLEEKEYIIFMRPHPSYPGIMPEGIEKVKRIIMLDSGLVPEIMEVVTAFDLLVTDYSSLFIDWLITGKPMAFIPYDLDLYDTKIGFSVPFEQHTPGPRISSSKEFLAEMEKLLEDERYYRDERNRENDYFNPIRTENCRSNAEMIEELLKEY